MPSAQGLAQRSMIVGLGVMEPSFFALQKSGPLILWPAEFWSNATFAPQTHRDIVSGAKITAKII